MRRTIEDLKDFLANLFSRRTATHVPHGVLAWLFVLLAPHGVAISAIWSVAFIVYEIAQDQARKNQPGKLPGAYADIYGFLVGLAFTGLGVMVYYGVKGGL